MQRHAKRLWTTLIVGSSTLLVLAASAIGLVRLFDHLSPGYRTELAEEIASFAERPVEVGRLDLEWNGLHPALVLGDLKILTHDHRALIFGMNELSVSVSWLALLKGELRPQAVELRGLTLGLEWRSDGRLGIRDIDGGELVIDFAEVAKWTERLSHIRLRDSTIEWLEPGSDQSHLIQAVEADLTHREDFYQLTAGAALPLSWGKTVRVELTGQGDLALFESMKIQARAQVEALRPQPWITLFLRRDISLEGAALDAAARFVLSGAQLQQLAVEFQGAPGTVLMKKSSELLGTLPGPNGALELRTRADGWDIAIQRLGYGNGAQTKGELRYHDGGIAGEAGLNLSLARVDAAAVFSWLSIFEAVGDAHFPRTGASGELRQLELEWKQAAEQAGHYRFSSQLHQLTWPTMGSIPGVRALSGQLRADELGGEFQIDVTNGAATIPTVFDKSLPLDRLTGAVAWQHLPTGWQVNGRDLSLNLRSLVYRGAFELLLPSDGSSPVIDLTGHFHGNAEDAKPYIPIPPVLSADVGAWLTRGILRGKASNGLLELKGKLSDFPYLTPDHPGAFRVALDATDAALDYGAGWPQISQISGHVEIGGNSIRIETPSAQMLGKSVGPVTTRIDAFNDPVLVIDGQADTGLKTQLQFLGESPLRAEYGPLLGALQGDGASTLALHLELPLGDIDAFKVDGRVQLNEATLQYGGLNVPIEKVSGALNFNREGLHADSLRGQIFGLPFAARLSPMKGGVRIEADTQLSLPQDAAAFSDFVPAPWLKPMTGDSRWQLAGMINLDGSAAEFKLMSDLVGTALAFGDPLNKAADVALPTELLYLPKKEGFEIGVRAGQIGRARLKFKPTATGTALLRGKLQFGDVDDISLPKEPGLWMAGTLPTLDVDALLKALPFGATSQTAPEAPISLSWLGGGDWSIGSLKLGGMNLHDTRFAVQPQAGGLLLQLQGPDAQGQITWQQAGRGSVTGQFERLVLNFPKSVEPDPVAEDAQPQETPAFDPGGLPSISATVKELWLGKFLLGQAKVDVPAIATGIRIQELLINGGSTVITASGEWVRNNDQTSARLLMKINGNQFKELLAGVGFAPNVTTKMADVFVDAEWKPSADGLSTRALNGKVHFDLQQGAILNVDPGAGRILSLLSFNAIPRRLLGDFSDVTEKGTQFDKLQGTFVLTNGVAHTDDLRVKSSAVNIRVQGDVDFVRRRYDQRVSIKPKLSSGVALAGAVLAGPVVGLALLLGQTVLNQPIDSISTISYRLQGPFKNPDVQQVEVKKRKRPSVKSNTAPKAKTSEQP